MFLVLRAPTLTGVVIGGTMVRPTPAALTWMIAPAQLQTTWICRLTLAPPVEGPLPVIRPTLLTERVVGPGVG
jgi:hypothetical protein